MTEQSNFGIKLSVLTCNGAAPGNVVGTEFGASGGTIGNGAGNTLVLPDDTGGVAAHHADIRCVAGGWRMRNISERGTLTVNGKPLTPGGDMRVGVGDFIGLGPYVLRLAPGLVPPDWRADAAPARTDGAQAASAPDGLSPPHREAGPLSEAPSAGWLSDGTTLLESPIAFGDLTDVPVDPLALFGSVNRAWPGAHNPQAADLFGEEVSVGSRADGAPAPLEPRAHAGERRTPTELNNAFTMNVTTPGVVSPGAATLTPDVATPGGPTPEHRDELLRADAEGAPAMAPLSPEAFDAHGLFEEPDHAAMANASDDPGSSGAPWNDAVEPRVPMKVRYDTHFGVPPHDVTPATFAGPPFRFDELAARQASAVAPAPARGGRAAGLGAGVTTAGMATPSVATPGVEASGVGTSGMGTSGVAASGAATPGVARPAGPRRHEAGDLRARAAAPPPAEAPNDRFAALRASFPTTLAASRSKGSAAPLPPDVIDPLEIHATLGAQSLPTAQEDAVSALVGAFFAGAGISAHDAAAAGLDIEFMYMLGGVARTLLSKRHGPS
ncbi:FHA domain-containing protein [Paraburkholderia silviterrae]|uniref:FHA domain-containing protein n=1 Tax=Paraburkholderia silviterrae TaxID=2528715 RepID=A0A4V2ZZ59_9BURK|nr:FHA domain-containing protein [Paraburkholderia silviterrae]TDG23814.1 FHA domain-containing protein [Paraburkholderia silviterrae]